ncbi:hypothetical protein FH972_005708 [Carpinus fangiana]|uniref:Uncharacterized protein n=1 Tax=Carpinus fangiana TaxID=176857 RepID=A0A5N6QSJ0_9ROSI|nr:hypothetical protein FH972_005708 [Carpinus fangiana]
MAQKQKRLRFDNAGFVHGKQPRRQAIRPGEYVLGVQHHLSAVTLSLKSANVRMSSKGKNSFLKPGARHIWSCLPIATAIRDLQGLKATAFTAFLKEIRWRTTYRWRFMRRHHLFPSTIKRNTMSNDQEEHAKDSLIQRRGRRTGEEERGSSRRSTKVHEGNCFGLQSQHYYYRAGSKCRQRRER